jgi:hypothetical protein
MREERKRCFRAPALKCSSPVWRHAGARPTFSSIPRILFIAVNPSVASQTPECHG